MYTVLKFIHFEKLNTYKISEKKLEMFIPSKVENMRSFYN